MTNSNKNSKSKNKNKKQSLSYKMNHIYNKDNIDNNIKEEDIFLSNIELGFTSESFNTSDLDNGKEVKKRLKEFVDNQPK